MLNVDLIDALASYLNRCLSTTLAAISAIELAQELKEYSFGLQNSYCEHQDLEISRHIHYQLTTENRVSFAQRENNHPAKD